MGGRADGQDIQQAQFTIGVPFVFDEAFPAAPAVREQQRIAIQHPLEIHAIVDFVREFGNLGIVREILSGGEDAGQKERRVHRGCLAVPFAIAVGDVHPMVKPAVLLVGLIGEEFERGANALGRLFLRDPAVLGADAEGGEPETGGGGAGDIAAGTFGAATVYPRAIQHQAGATVGLLPEIDETAMLQVFHEGAIGGRDRGDVIGIDDRTRLLRRGLLHRGAQDHA